MKKIIGIFSMLFLLAITLGSCTDAPVDEPGQDGLSKTRSAGADATCYYWYSGEKIPLTLNTEYVNIVADDASLKSSKTGSSFQGLDLVQEDGARSGNVVKYRLTSKSTATDYSKLIKDLKQNKQIKHILPFFSRGANAQPIGTSDIFYLKLKDEKDFATLKLLAEEQKVQIVKEVPYMPLWYIMSIHNSSFGSSVDASNYFYETGHFADVDPAFMFDFKPNVIPNDPMFGQLWGLKNNSYPDIDINVTAAWDITRGAGAKVAVLDQGIDRSHNDLNANLHTLSYDAQTGKSPSVFVNGLSHGTHVAGTVAAVWNNNLQVVGVAPEAKIIGVSHDLYLSTTFSAELASGFSWAWQNGADVLTNSWGDQGGAFYDTMHSAILEQAIIDAMTKGRDGLGCVVTFAAGNYSGVMDYPGNFHDDILTVGSIDSNGSKSSFSGYGTKLDVVAPGSNILSTIPGNSTGQKSGTSMATPHIAGVAALVISKNPTFTRLQVVTAIEKSGKKVGGYLYKTTSGRPNGLWVDYMGYGLVDAYAAVNYVPDKILFYDQHVTTDQIVQGRKVETKNVTVSNNAKLTIIGTESVTSLETLHVNAGCRLEIRN